jgi:hypothetical protein
MASATATTLRDEAILQLQFGASVEQILDRVIQKTAMRCLDVAREYPDSNEHEFQDITEATSANIASEIEEMFSLERAGHVFRSVVSVEGTFDDINVVDAKTRWSVGSPAMTNVKSMDVFDVMCSEGAEATLVALTQMQETSEHTRQRFARDNKPGKLCTVEVTPIAGHPDLAVIEVRGGATPDGALRCLDCPTWKSRSSICSPQTLDIVSRS